MTAPRVSVIMPVLNNATFMPAAIASILSQTYTSLELIVVDNGSSDGSYEYATSLNDERVAVIHEPRRGAAFATFAGIQASRGEYIAIMDSDDVAHTHRIAVEVEYLDSHPKVVLVGTRFAFIIGDTLVPSPPQPSRGKDIRKALMSGRALICNPSTMFRSEAARAIIPCSSLPGPGADVDFFLRIGELGDLSNIPQILHYYRLHDSMTSYENMSLLRMLHAYARDCALARKTNRAEPTLDEFRITWNRRPWIVRRVGSLNDTAYTLYRRSLLYRTTRKTLRAVVLLIAAGVIAPHRAIWNVKRRLGIC